MQQTNISVCKWFSTSGTGKGFPNFPDTVLTADNELFLAIFNWKILLEYIEHWSPEDYEIIYQGTTVTDHNDDNEVRIDQAGRIALREALERLEEQLRVERERIHKFTSKRKENGRYKNVVYRNFCLHLIRIVEWSIEKKLPFEVWAE